MSQFFSSMKAMT